MCVCSSPTSTTHNNWGTNCNGPGNSKETTMICVECDEPVKELYTEYANGHIKLTDCRKCHRTTDKYVEFDSVILFIDVLLMKPQAYKHLVFNLMSSDYNYRGRPEEEETKITGFSRWIRRNKVQRIRFLAVLFEIYLTWAYEEKNYNKHLTHDIYLISNAILERPVAVQYALFALKCFCEDVVTHWIVQRLVFQWLRWNPRTLSERDSHRYFSDALSLAIIISGGTKLFPILMLIWPYDDVTITNVINSVANFNLIESLRAVTRCSYTEGSIVFTCVTLAKFITTRLVLVLILSRLDWSIMKLFAQTEYIHLLSQFNSLFHTIATN